MQTNSSDAQFDASALTTHLLSTAVLAAELEVLAAATMFFRRVGVGPEIVGFKINSRKVLESLLAQLGIKGDLFAQACVQIDKLDKIGPEGVTAELVSFVFSMARPARMRLTGLPFCTTQAQLGVDKATADKILSAMAAQTIDELAGLVEGVRCPGLKLGTPNPYDF
eukprot:SAG31_NODE_3162_length_4606_cov_22.721544_6_plen_167_part_00